MDTDGDLDLALVDEIANEVIILANQGMIFADGLEAGSFQLPRFSRARPAQ